MGRHFFDVSSKVSRSDTVQILSKLFATKKILIFYYLFKCKDVSRVNTYIPTVVLRIKINVKLGLNSSLLRELNRI